MSSLQVSDKSDHWSAEAYKQAASFVPALTNKVVSYLDPQAGDHILDLGCGDGVLTAELAKVVAPKGGEVLGLDASPSMISSADQQFGTPNCTFKVQDCATLSTTASEEILASKWDKVFSNAAMHWIMRNEKTREGVLHAAHAVLKPGGVFAFEMGGHGNVAEAHTALISALVAHGIPLSEARQASPWFFPSDMWMREKLEALGFAVEICELEYRATKATPKREDGKGGIEGWVRLMGAEFLHKVSVDKRDSVVEMVCGVLEGVVTRGEDGSQWFGYVRLRVKAVKK